VSRIRTLRLAGDAVARGRTHGAAFRDDIRRYTDERVRLASNGSWAGRPATRRDVLGLAEEMLPAHRAYAPEVYAEMVAMADAAGISAAEAVIVGGFTDFVDAVRARGDAPLEDDCTAVIVPDSRAEGAGWLAQTWDMHDSATEHVVLLDLDPDDGPAALVFTTVGCVGQIGMNAAGLAVGIDNLTANDGRVGVTWPFVVRRMLGQRTADDAVQRVLEAPLAGGHEYLVLDALGAGAGVEALPTHVAVTRLAGDVLAHTNHVLDPIGRTREAPRPAELQESSRQRLARALELTRAPVLGRDALFALTRDPTICRASEPPYHLETSGAVVMRPRTRELFAVWRSPAEHEYERFLVRGGGIG
jgi:isopenicillin-N N-acyltransferase-like protein